MLQTIKTSPDQFEQFLKLLPQTPIFIPIIKHGKKPEVSAGESWKDQKYHLTPEQAIIRLCEGKNVGVVANDWLVIVDLDNPAKYKLDKKTLTIQTRNGKLHMYFQNAGDVENSIGKNALAKCGEVRAEWQYVLSPGSYVPIDDDKTELGTGLYHIIDPQPLAELTKNDLPADFIPTAETTQINPEILNTQFTTRNKHGWTLEDIRGRDKKLDELLNNQNSGLPSASEADMSTLTKLLWWDFTEGEAVAILKKYRPRPKLDRANYITNMLGHISRKETISTKIDPKKWNIKTGYMIELNFGSEKTQTTTTTNNRKDLTALILDVLKQDYQFKTPTDTQELHYYKNGIYTPAECDIKKRLEKELGPTISTGQVTEILEHLKWHSYTDRTNFNKYNGYLPFNNGLLELKTLTLQPFNPEQIFTYKLTDDYNPNADCPKFKKWLTEVQTPDNIQTLQEYAGYGLLPKMPFHKSIWFIGTGRNGKSTYMNTLKSIFGEHNISYVSLQKLNGERNFIEIDFYGKLINIANEPATKNELQTPLFKALTGNDFISAEVKNVQKKVIFQNYAKFYIIGNKYPRVRDNSTAFKQRIIIIKWEKEFLEGNGQIQDIENNWLNDPTERSGIINWMLEGLHRLIMQGKFSMTKSQDENMLEFERNSDSIAAWLHERIIYNKDRYVEREDAFNDYIDYCDYYGIYQGEKNKFFSYLRNTGKIKDVYKKIIGKTTRVWGGIELKPKLQTENDETTPNNSQKQLGDTPDTLDTPFSNSTEKNKKNNFPNELQKGVSGVSSVSKIEVPGYDGALTCVFCEKVIVDDNWTRDDFTWDKPAHNSCYDRKKDELTNQDERG